MIWELRKRWRPPPPDQSQQTLSSQEINPKIQPLRRKEGGSLGFHRGNTVQASPESLHLILLVSNTRPHVQTLETILWQKLRQGVELKYPHQDPSELPL